MGVGRLCFVGAATGAAEFYGVRLYVVIGVIFLNKCVFINRANNYVLLPLDVCNNKILMD